MFGSERPARVQRTIWIAAHDTETLSCARCTEQVFSRDVAFFTRSKPGDAFDPWCSGCAYQFAHWGLVGAGIEDDDSLAGVVLVVEDSPA